MTPIRPIVLALWLTTVTGTPATAENVIRWANLFNRPIFREARFR